MLRGFGPITNGGVRARREQPCQAIEGISAFRVDFNCFKQIGDCLVVPFQVKERTGASKISIATISDIAWLSLKRAVGIGDSLLVVMLVVIKRCPEGVSRSAIGMLSNEFRRVSHRFVVSTHERI